MQGTQTMLLPGGLLLQESSGAQSTKAGASFSVFIISLKTVSKPLQG